MSKNVAENKSACDVWTCRQMDLLYQRRTSHQLRYSECVRKQVKLSKRYVWKPFCTAITSHKLC